MAYRHNQSCELKSILINLANINNRHRLNSAILMSLTTSHHDYRKNIQFSDCLVRGMVHGLHWAHSHRQPVIIHIVHKSCFATHQTKANLFVFHTPQIHRSSMKNKLIADQTIYRQTQRTSGSMPLGNNCQT